MTPVVLLLLLESPVPLDPGTFWEYRESYTEQIGEVAATTDEVTRIAVRGSAARPFLDQRGGADPAPGPVESGDGWLRLAPFTGEDALPLPLEVGRSGPPSEGGAAWTVEGEDEVVVPAGTFRALRCAFRAGRAESVLWIAPGVGVVRQLEGTRGRVPEIERVLLRWGKPGAPAGDRPGAPPGRARSLGYTF
jgi:hypothetical protein